MPNETLEESPRSTLDNWEALQALFIGLKMPIEGVPKGDPKPLDNWDVLQTLFQLTPKIPENTSTAPSLTNNSGIDNSPQLNVSKKTSLQPISLNNQPQPSPSPSKKPSVNKPTHRTPNPPGNTTNPRRRNIPATNPHKPSNPTPNPLSSKNPATVAFHFEQATPLLQYTLPLQTSRYSNSIANWYDINRPSTINIYVAGTNQSSNFLSRNQPNNSLRPSIKIDNFFNLLNKNSVWFPFASIALFLILVLLEITLVYGILHFLPAQNLI